MRRDACALGDFVLDSRPGLLQNCCQAGGWRTPTDVTRGVPGPIGTLVKEITLGQAPISPQVTDTWSVREDAGAGAAESSVSDAELDRMDEHVRDLEYIK